MGPLRLRKLSLSTMFRRITVGSSGAQGRDFAGRALRMMACHVSHRMCREINYHDQHRRAVSTQRKRQHTFLIIRCRVGVLSAAYWLHLRTAGRVVLCCCQPNRSYTGLLPEIAVAAFLIR